jgi:hypothetical protein
MSSRAGESLLHLFIHPDVPFKLGYLHLSKVVPAVYYSQPFPSIPSTSPLEKIIEKRKAKSTFHQVNSYRDFLT